MPVTQRLRVVQMKRSGASAAPERRLASGYEEGSLGRAKS
jgi:hypothetical protein